MAYTAVAPLPFTPQPNPRPCHWRLESIQ